MLLLCSYLHSLSIFSIHCLSTGGGSSGGGSVGRGGGTGGGSGRGPRWSKGGGGNNGHQSDSNTNHQAFSPKPGMVTNSPRNQDLCQLFNGVKGPLGFLGIPDGVLVSQ